jgi:CMP-N,N'-diacetyllegionaminic acid synthase
MKILAIIPARGGSKGVPRKNIRLVAGKPLIAYTIAAALAATRLDRFFVSTDSEEIAAVAGAHGAGVRLRPAALAEDQTSTLAVLQHHLRELAAEGYEPDAVMTLQPTSPLRTARHIDDAIAQFAADLRADSLVSCIAVPHIFHPRSVMRRDADGYLTPFLGETGPTRRQEKEAVFARNGAAVYITRTSQLAHYVFGGRLLPFFMTEEDSLDIDTEDDLIRADRILSS